MGSFSSSSVSVSASNYKPTKAGYKKFLKDSGIDWDGYSAVLPTFSQFKYATKSEIDRLYEELERVNILWRDALLAGGDDSTNNLDSKLDSQAYSCKINARKLVRRIEELENGKLN